ncbi:MAG: minor capsid protein [Thermodesulfovibrionales bacterium]|nr:minor capsid protein [Thermodesulfovibrionales bacterium]
MKILGFEIKKAAAEVSSGAQITAINPQGPMTSVFQDYVRRKVSGDFYEKLREGIPIIDAAIRRLISLNGTIKIIGDNAPIVRELEDFCLDVPVNDTQKGIHAFLENASNETFEQGFCMAEFVATKDLKDIECLRVADSKNIVFRRNKDGKAEPWYRYPSSFQSSYSMPSKVIEQILTAQYGQTLSIGGIDEVKLNPENKLYFSINNENSDPYGVSMMRSMEFVSQILVTLQNSMKNVGERFGDPSFHMHIKTKAGSPDALKALIDATKIDLTAVVATKRAGGSADMVTAGSLDGDVAIKIIGHDGQVMSYDIPLRHVLEQIVSKTNLPAWMLGIYWSTTERMATLEVESALQDAKIRQLMMFPEFIRLFSSFLKLRGRKWSRVTTSLDKPGDWGIIFETPNLRDLVAQAQARFLNAQADMMGSAPPAQTNITLGSASAEIRGMKFPLLLPVQKSAQKETQRPIQWPELDKVEADYEAELKFDWEDLKGRVLTILKLNDRNPLGKGQKEDIPSIESFIFSEEQRAAVLKSLENYIGEYDWRDANSAVRWYYGQSYSLGLIQAAHLLGKDRPILDIIKNREVYEELCKSGFEFVKDNATKAIVGKIIPEMEAQMLAGSNPRHVASRLEKLFTDQNADWERLARTEMTMAAEAAKKDEWKAWDVKKQGFRPAPDACPLCASLSGDYPIDDCPVPARDTHPRCRCTTVPV